MRAFAQPLGAGAATLGAAVGVQELLPGEVAQFADAEAFRGEIREWLVANLPAGWGTPGFELTGEARKKFVEEWPSKLFAGGWICATWPKEYGGGGKPYSYQAIYLEETARAEAPQHLGVIGLGMAGPTIIARGTEAQKARYLQPLLSAAEIWRWTSSLILPA
mgnify:CR=1 FL=1